MMKRLIEYGIFLLMALPLVSCGDKLVSDGDRPDLMVFTPLLPASVSRATETEFEDGDEIGIFAVDYDDDGEPRRLEISGNWANNSKASNDAGKWTVSPPVYWKGDDPFDIYSYYPYVPEVGSIDNFRFEVKSDQRGKGFTLSDFLWAKSESVTRNGGEVPLHFTHRLSRLDINLVKGPDYEGDLPAEAVVKVHGTVPVALVDLESGDVEKNPDSPAGTVIACCTGPASYSAVIVPQKIMNQIPLVEVIVNDVSYLLSSKFIFGSGMRHTVDIILSDSPDKVLINIGGKIIDWNQNDGN
ncbi:MAG: fimbrillin family protein [Candidatus Cryptobacteroides sp.]